MQSEPEIKYMDIKEFREGGYLQEVNRRFLHPLGLALEIKIHDDDSVSLGGIWDYRDDPEGMRYEDLDLEHHYLKIQNEWYDKSVNRVRTLGYMVQPAADDAP